MIVSGNRSQHKSLMERRNGGYTTRESVQRWIWRCARSENDQRVIGTSVTEATASARKVRRDPGWACHIRGTGRPSINGRSTTIPSRNTTIHSTQPIHFRNYREGKGNSTQQRHLPTKRKQEIRDRGHEVQRHRQLAAKRKIADSRLMKEEQRSFKPRWNGMSYPV